MNCEHKHTGSCSPAGVYLYVICMDCRTILNESEEGRRLRLACPGFEAEKYASGSCAHCHYDAQHHYDAIAAKLTRIKGWSERGDLTGHQRWEQIDRELRATV